MNQKLDITKYLAEQWGLDTDQKSLKQLNTLWWQNPRNKIKGGLRFTDEGFSRASAHLKYHKVNIDDGIDYNSQLIIRLDNLIDCPWYLSTDYIFLFDEKIAVQMILFSGNIARFTDAKVKNRLTTQ
jgi:hypothetical protein